MVARIVWRADSVRMLEIRIAAWTSDPTFYPSPLGNGRSTIRIAAPLFSRSAQLVAGNRNWSTLVAGVNGGYLVAREWRIERGRSFTAVELASAAKVAIVGAVVEQELFAGQPAIGNTLRAGCARPYR